MGLEVRVFLNIAIGGRSRNNQRCPRIINQHRIYLIHNGKVMLLLDKIAHLFGHVVTQVIKAKLIVGSKNDILSVGHSSLFRVGLVLVNAIHLQAMELIHRTHPL